MSSSRCSDSVSCRDGNCAEFSDSGCDSINDFSVFEEDFYR